MDYVTRFNKFCEDRNASVAVSAIKTLALVVEHTQANTLKELHTQLVDVISQICLTDASVVSVKSGCELFMRFITLHHDLDYDIKQCLLILRDRAKIFIDKVDSCRDTIAKSAMPVVKDGCRIMLHSRSRVVLTTLKAAFDQGRQFTCYVTTCHTDNSGQEMTHELIAHGIAATLIADTAVGYFMTNVDLVIVGAEAVVESGGIINRLGTCTVAMVARLCKKPVYVLAESFKFSRLFPLDQRHIPDELKYPASVRNQPDVDLSKEHPLVDYTPPEYLTLLFTDLGVLTTSAVSDELIRLYL